MLQARSEYQEGSYWFYAPNKGGPIAFAILFTASGIVHGYQCVKYRSWKVTGLFPWAALLFSIGFALRTAGAFGNWDNLDIYIASTVLLLAGPPIYEAANFFTLGRILYYVPYHSPIHPGRVFTTFIALSAVIESITGSGAALLANAGNPQKTQEVGRSLIKAALILQILQMVGFVALALKFLSNCSRAHMLNWKIKRPLIVLLVSCFLIISRTIFRTVEYFTAASLSVTDINDISPILKDEWFFWVFETSLMFTNTAMLNILHPMETLPRSNKIYLATDGVTEIEGPGYKDPRHVLLTLFDPFDIVGIITNKKQVKYWENSEASSDPSSKA